MCFKLEKYKGIHPGIILERLLAKKEISQRPFALSLGEHPQTINAITKGRRNLNTALALKIEAALDFIQRIYERGNDTEKKELELFYGAKKIKTALQNSRRKPYTIYKNKRKA